MKNIFIATALVSTLGLTGCLEHKTASQQGSVQQASTKAVSQNNFEMQEGDISLECKGRIYSSTIQTDEITINFIHSPRFPQISKIYSNVSADSFGGQHVPRKEVVFIRSDVDYHWFEIDGNSFTGKDLAGKEEFFKINLNRKDLSATVTHNNSGIDGWHQMKFDCVKADKSYFTTKATEYTNKMAVSNSLNKI
jgi:hypothetical protein